MADIDFSAEIADLRHTYESIEAVSDVEQIRADIAELSEQASAPNLWDDPSIGQQVTSALSRKENELERLTSLAARIDDLEVMIELAEEAHDTDLYAEANTELASIKKALGQLETVTLLSGEYDEREAVVSIRAGAGGVDASDFTQMLLRCICVGPSTTDTPPKSWTLPTRKRQG